MSAEVAEKKAENLLRRWASLIGEELTIFARSSTTGVYSEGAQFRLANRADLPKRPPRRMKAESIIPVKSPPIITEPLLPDPTAVNSNVQKDKSTVCHQPPPQNKTASSPTSSLNALRPKAAQVSGVAPPKAPPKVSILRSTVPNPQPSSQPQQPRTPAVPKAQASSASGGVPITNVPASLQNVETNVLASQDVRELPPAEEWENDNDHLDTPAILTSISRLCRDVEMLQARLVGGRRNREFTPGSENHRSKFVCVDHTPPHQLDFSGVSNSSIVVPANVGCTTAAEVLPTYGSITTAAIAVPSADSLAATAANAAPSTDGPAATAASAGQLMDATTIPSSAALNLLSN